ncbi:MAG: hypothetical protein EGR74_08585 [Ruminiclostridium sp.]|nr:hypothetical protein [Ruminiclostridium sp.]MBE5716319.1 hypothetical protein [Ruminiclostridium sp.]
MNGGVTQINKTDKRLQCNAVTAFCIIIFISPHQPYQNRTITFSPPRTITLASLVKGEVLSPEIIRATTGGIAFLPHHNFSFFILNYIISLPLTLPK